MKDCKFYDELRANFIRARLQEHEYAVECLLAEMQDKRFEDCAEYVLYAQHTYKELVREINTPHSFHEFHEKRTLDNRKRAMKYAEKYGGPSPLDIWDEKNPSPIDVQDD